METKTTSRKFDAVNHYNKMKSQKAIKEKYPLLTKETLMKMLIEDYMSDSEIAARIGCTIDIVQDRRHRWQIKKEARKAPEAMVNHLRLTRPEKPEHTGEFAEMQDFLFDVSIILYRRYNRLITENKRLADYGINRHRKYTGRVGCAIDESAIREIIDDAERGRSIARENQIEMDATDYSKGGFSDEMIRAFFGSDRQKNARRANKHKRDG